MLPLVCLIREFQRKGAAQGTVLGPEGQGQEVGFRRAGGNEVNLKTVQKCFSG